MFQATSDAEVHLQSTCSQPFEATKVFKYTVNKYKIAAEGEDVKQVYDLMLKSDSSIDYRFKPGDTVGILTKNFDSDVDAVLTRLELDSDSYYRVEVDPTTKKKRATIPPYIPSIIQLRKLLSECLDLKAIPRKARKPFYS